jgi:hypothetical protein
MDDNVLRWMLKAGAELEDGVAQVHGITAKVLYGPLAGHIEQCTIQLYDNTIRIKNNHISVDVDVQEVLYKAQVLEVSDKYNTIILRK